MNIDLMTVLMQFLQVIVMGLSLPFLMITSLSYLNGHTKAELALHFGRNSQIFVGALGIMIHELSHLLVALLFGHRVTKVALLRIPRRTAPDENGQPDTRLGYVYHTWNPSNLYQVAGNFFIGIAPIFGCTLALMGITQLLLPETASQLWQVAQTPTLSGFIQLFNPSILLQGSPLAWLLFILLAITISIGGFDLSQADLANSNLGATVVILGLSLMTIFLSLTGAATGWVHLVTMIGLTLIIFMGYALVLSLIAAGIVALFSLR